MQKSLQKILKGYHEFRKKYASGDQSIMSHLSRYGQKPQVMVVACCDSRVDPALILQCVPGDLFVVRNMANIVPPCKYDGMPQNMAAALEFGVCCLKVKHLVLLGHSQCSGIKALLNKEGLAQDDFITDWVSIVGDSGPKLQSPDDYAKLALQRSHQNCLTFPWISEKIAHNKLSIHLWFFDIKAGQVFTYSDAHGTYKPLDT